MVCPTRVCVVNNLATVKVEVTEIPPRLFSAPARLRRRRGGAVCIVGFRRNPPFLRGPPKACFED